MFSDQITDILFRMLLTFYWELEDFL